MKRIVLLLSIALFATNQAQALPESYTITDLSALDGHGIAGAINSGAIPGSHNNHAALFDGESITDLGTVSGYTHSTAHALNGPVTVGAAFNIVNGGVSAMRAAVFNEGSAASLGTLEGNSEAVSVNASGIAVGYSSMQANGRPWPRATMFSGGSVIDLGVLPSAYRPHSVANCINDNGVAVGESMTGRVYSGGRWIAPCHAVCFSGGAVTDLGALSGYVMSTAYSINSSGLVVGIAYNTQADHRAVVFENGNVYDLNSFLQAGSGWTLTHAYAVNDAGDIIGQGMLNGSPRIFKRRVNKGLTRGYQ